MARLITTDSGAEYLIRDGRITRTARHDLIGYDDPIVREPFIMLAPPVEGGVMRFRLKSAPDFPVRTSRVILIVEDIEKNLHAPREYRDGGHTGAPGCTAGPDRDFCYDCELGEDN